MQSLKKYRKSGPISKAQKSRRKPVCNVSLVHELEALIGRQSAPLLASSEKKTYLTDLGEEGHKLTERLKMRVIEGAQELRDHQLLAGVG